MMRFEPPDFVKSKLPNPEISQSRSGVVNTLFPFVSLRVHSWFPFL